MNIKQRFEQSTAILNVYGNPLSETDIISLKKIIMSIVNSGIDQVILDFSEVKHINSIGIGGLLHARKALEKVNGEVKLVRVNNNVRNILKRTALERIFRTYPTIEHALQS